MSDTINNEKTLQKKISKMSFEEAEEYIDYNCIGAWIGDQTPIIVMPLELE